MLNLTSKKSSYAVWIKAYNRSPLQNIELKDCFFDNVEKENVLESVENLEIESVVINGKEFTFKKDKL